MSRSKKLYNSDLAPTPTNKKNWGWFEIFNVWANASSDEVVALLKGINTVAKKLSITLDTGKGYRALTNIGEHGGQEVPHLHFHLFGGERVGKMVE